MYQYPLKGATPFEIGKAWDRKYSIWDQKIMDYTSGIESFVVFE